MSKQEQQKNLINAISHTLQLISDTQNLIEELLKAGEREESLTLRQYRHLKSRYAKNVDNLLQQLDTNLHLEYTDNAA